MQRTRTNRRDQNRMLNGAIKGAVAGAIGVWVMDRVDWFAYNHEPEEIRQRTRAARPDGMDPAHVAANKAADIMGKELSPPQPHPLGTMVHYSLGVGPGAIYGALREQVPALTIGRGSLFGLGLFLTQDEAVNALTGLSGKPRAYPWQDHARGLVAHMVFGFVMDTVLSAFSRAEAKTSHQQSSQVAWSETREREPEDYSYPASSREAAESARH